MKQTIRFPFLTVFALFSAFALKGAPPEIEVSNSAILLKGGGAEYHFDNGRFFHLRNAAYQGKPLSITKLDLTYLIHNGDWYWEESPFPDYKMGTYQFKTEKKGNTVRLAVTAEGPRMKLARTFTMHGDDPTLEVGIRLEVTGENKIAWTNLFGTPVPADSHLVRLVTTEENGIPVSRIRSFKEPFLDEKGNFIELGNFREREWPALPLAGSYDPVNNRGTLFLIRPEKSQWLFRLGQLANKKRKYLGIAPAHFTPGDGKTCLNTEFKIIPFAGKPEALQETVAAPLIRELRKYHLIADHYETAGLIRNGEDFALWQELPDNKVFRSSKAPRAVKKTVTLYAARGETESFQMVINPKNQNLSEVSLEVTPLLSGAGTIPSNQITWNSIGCMKAEIPWNSSTEMLGEQPDTLLGSLPSMCRKGTAQPFFITVNVPEVTSPGIYEGKVKVLNQGKIIAEVPLKIRVWSFSVANQTLTAAFDFWRRNQKYPKEKQQAVQDAVEKMVVAHRGGARWTAMPSAKWDAEGNLTHVDFKPFDDSMEKFIRKYKHGVIVARMFMLGYGHIPRRNFFGTAKEILTSLWKKKVLSFAKSLSAHLKEKGWNDRIVFDLFDEPNNEYAYMVNDTVKLLHTVDPSWRFTLAGNYNPLFKDSIHYWNVTMESCTPYLAEKIRKAGGEVTVYNPPGYRYTESPTLARGNYWWLWKNRISYIYQWVVNCWSEHGYTGWDDYRYASWIAPGPEGPLSTLRLSATRDGIEDYEYLTLLRKTIPEIRKSNPELAEQGERLLQRVSETAWTTPQEEIAVVVTQNPAVFHELHKEMGKLLDKIATAAK